MLLLQVPCQLTNHTNTHEKGKKKNFNRSEKHGTDAKLLRITVIEPLKDDSEWFTIWRLYIIYNISSSFIYSLSYYYFVCVCLSDIYRHRVIAHSWEMTGQLTGLNIHGRSQTQFEATVFCFCFFSVCLFVSKRDSRIANQRNTLSYEFFSSFFLFFW